jgi:hypothetical protein
MHGETVKFVNNSDFGETGLIHCRDDVMTGISFALSWSSLVTAILNRPEPAGSKWVR